MSIDKNSTNYRIGVQAEQCWAQRLINQKCGRVTRPNDQPCNVEYCGDMDFKVTNRSGTSLYEVKYRACTFMYANKFPCYTFDVSKIEGYMDTCKTQDTVDGGRLIIYDWAEKKIFGASFNQLHKPFNVLGKKFPFDLENSDGDMIRYFHQEQFPLVKDMAPTEIAQLNAILTADKPVNSPAPVQAQPAPIAHETAPPRKRSAKADIMKSFRCPPDLNEEVDELAYLERRTWASICIEALEKFVAEKKRARIDDSRNSF